MSVPANYDWQRGVFNPACVCGDTINHPNHDCERCMMHDWIYNQDATIKRLEAEVNRDAVIAQRNAMLSQPLTPHEVGQIRRILQAFDNKGA